jgi:hypothetical protein
MEQFFAAARRAHLKRVFAALARVAVGAVGAAVIPGILLLVFSPLSNSGTQTCTDASKPATAASVLIASAHRWAADAARRRAELEATEAARQARIDMAAEDLLNHD